MERQFGQGSPVHREGLAKTGRERAVECRKVLIFRPQRAISCQSREHLAFGRRGLISLKSFVSNVGRGRVHCGPSAGVFRPRSFLCLIRSRACARSLSFSQLALRAQTNPVSPFRPFLSAPCRFWRCPAATGGRLCKCRDRKRPSICRFPNRLGRFIQSGAVS